MDELGSDKTIPEGWKRSVELEDMAFTGGSTNNLPEGWKQNNPNRLQDEVPKSEDSSRLVGVETTRSLEDLEKVLKLRWSKSKYSLVLGKMTLTRSWPMESKNIKQSLWEWMAENEEMTLVEEAEDILDGLEAMSMEEGT